MLYGRWREVVAAGSDRIALVECRSGRSWTFAGLAAAAEETGDEGPGVAFPTGRDADFVVAVLRAWREGRPVCPLDAGQRAEEIPALPPACLHLKLTSATTGGPRLVGFTADQLAADADKIIATMGLGPDEPNLGVISLAHSYGFSNLVLPLLLSGVPLILVESPLPEALRRAASGSRSFTLPAVPALWRTWHEAGAIPASVRTAISAGAPLPGALERAIFEGSGLKVHNFYGATECGGIAYDTTNEPRNDESWVGRAMPGVELAVLEDGCLEVRGPSVGMGYLPPDPRHLGHGRYRTSDLGELRDGGVHLRGRVTDLINVAGRKVAPDVVEAALLSHPSIQSCVVFGTPDEDAARFDRMVAVVAVDDGVPEAVLRAHAQERLPAWQVPREWRRVPRIAVNARGKVSRATWRERFIAGELDGDERSKPANLSAAGAA